MPIISKFSLAQGRLKAALFHFSSYHWLRLISVDSLRPPDPTNSYMRLKTELRQWYPLATLAMALPWLIPVHTDPWPSFYSEAAMAGVFVLILLVSAAFAPKEWDCSAPALAFALMATIPLIQAIFGINISTGEAIVISLYLLSISLAILLGGSLYRYGNFAIVDILFSSFIVSSIVSVAIALYQWFGLASPGSLFIITSAPGARALANLAQPNNLATLLCWGLVALLWFFQRQALSGKTVLMAAAFFLTGIALTASRTAWLQISLIFIAVIYQYRRSAYKYNLSIVLLGIWFIAIFWILSALGAVLWGSASRSTGELTATGNRPYWWRMALDGLLDRPLLGYGWNQGTVLHVNLSNKYSGLDETMGHTHNIILDILVWNGFPVGISILLVFIWWCFRRFDFAGAAHPPLSIILALCVLLMHSLLELPHLYAFFLIPAALLIGVLGGFNNEKVVVRIRGVYILSVGLLMFGALSLATIDYLRIEDSLRSRRIQAAWPGLTNPQANQEIYILRHLQSALHILEIKPDYRLDSNILLKMKSTVTRYPTTSGLMRYALSSAKNSNLKEAEWALQVLCDLRPRSVCVESLKEWKVLSERGAPEMRTVVLPVYPGD